MSQPLDRLVADNLDIWTCATLRKSGAGWGGGKRTSLYGIERLRALILDLAVRGKLVPQDAGDEPAAALLPKWPPNVSVGSKLVKSKMLRGHPTRVANRFICPPGGCGSRFGRLATFLQATA